MGKSSCCDLGIFVYNRYQWECTHCIYVLSNRCLGAQVLWISSSIPYVVPLHLQAPFAVARAFVVCILVSTDSQYSAIFFTEQRDDSIFCQAASNVYTNGVVWEIYNCGYHRLLVRSAPHIPPA
jgi:hypothetical protein